MAAVRLPRDNVPERGVHGAPELLRPGRPDREVPGRGRGLVESETAREESHQPERHASHPGPAQQTQGSGVPPGFQHGIHGKMHHIFIHKSSAGV